VAVHFDRLIRGLPVFEGGIVVGVSAKNAVILVNSSDVPERVTGRMRISRNAAIRAAKAAIPGLEASDLARADRGWRSTGHVVRPVWRVDVTAIRPSGDWRSYVDAETGKVLARVDLRSSVQQGKIAPQGMAPDRVTQPH
jgi:Zn-dependent metalloprotease